jgi:hypothetical protein
MVDQMQLIKSKTLPKRKPPVVKDKGKEKRIEEASEVRKNPPMVIGCSKTFTTFNRDVLDKGKVKRDLESFIFIPNKAAALNI